jgi:imidazolonepropionase
LEELTVGVINRANRHFREGVTTIEVKSGYGLTIEQEVKMLRAIKAANFQLKADLVPTCLAAHVSPKHVSQPNEWLEEIEKNLFGILQEQELAKRIDIFIEDEAFPAAIAEPYLLKAKRAGFQITAHADQFSSQGTKVAVRVGAASADHLERTDHSGIKLLAQSEVVAVALPGASLGLGIQYTPARKLLDAGSCLAIATDWNPGSAPMGDLLMQAAVLGAAQKLSLIETLAAITFRAAYALRLSDRGVLAKEYIADFISFPTKDYRDILYYQGKMKPSLVWKSGSRLLSNT